MIHFFLYSDIIIWFESEKSILSVMCHISSWFLVFSVAVEYYDLFSYCTAVAIVVDLLQILQFYFFETID